MKRHWWQDAIVYQIYPRSFMDGNGDGIGDLPGIVSRLDYLRSLGIDTVWLSPIYKSPNDDMGYDIADYQDIMDEFGTMADFDALLAGVHERGMRLIMDLVVNHTSDEHVWFEESRRSRNSRKRDWYIWRPAKPGGGPPNNWLSEFGGSAWELDGKTGEYYLHLFSRKQPDLNWTNPEVRDAVFAMMRWWLDKGVDGFRMDVISMIAKAPGFPDAEAPAGATAAEFLHPGKLAHDRPELHAYLKEMNEKVLRNYDGMTVGECHGITRETGLLYIDRERHELDMIFQFSIKWLMEHGDTKLAFAEAQSWAEAYRGRAWNSAVLGNHDGGRIVSSAGDPERWRAESAKLLNTVLLTLPGAPFVYQGDELAMASAVLPRIEDYRDVSTLNQYRELLSKGMPAADALAKVQASSRDRSRTPMQWSGEPQAGFTCGTPWLPVNPDHGEWNVAAQETDPNSVLNSFRRLARWRKENVSFVHADFQTLDGGSETLHVCRRVTADAREYLMAYNFSGQPQTLALEAAVLRAWRVEFSTDAGKRVGADQDAVLRLDPWEAVILRRGSSSGCP